MAELTLEVSRREESGKSDHAGRTGTDRAARTGVGGGTSGRRAGRHHAARRGQWRVDQDDRHRRGDRGRPRRRASGDRRTAVVPAGRRGPGRGVGRRRRWTGPVDPRPDRRHRELPVRPAGVRCVAGRRGRRYSRRRRGPQCRHRTGVDRGPRRRGVPRRPPADRLDRDGPCTGAAGDRLRVRSGAAGVPGAGTRRAAAAGARRAPVRGGSTCAWRPKGPSTCTTRRA